MTPTLHREGPCRFFCYSHEPREPPHVHVEHDDAIAKLWRHDASLADGGGLPPQDLRRILAIVTGASDGIPRGLA